MEVVVARQTYLKIGGDVAHDDGGTVAHGFEQGYGKPFVRRGQHIAAAVVEQGMEAASLDEACEDDAILLGQFAKLDGIGVLEVGVTGYDELVAVGIDLREGLDELMKVLLRSETAHAQDVLAMLDAKVTEIAGFVDIFGSCHAIVNEVHLARDAVLSVHHVAYALADDDDTVGKDAAHGFAQTEHQFGCPSPLDAVVVLAVMGEDHLHVEHTGERNEQSGTAGMDMHNLRLELLGADNGLEGMDDGFERLLAWCIDVDEFDTLPMGKVVVAVTGTSYDGHVITLFDQTGEELFAVRLDTAHDVGDAARAGNYYAILLFLHERLGFRSPWRGS